MVGMSAHLTRFTCLFSVKRLAVCITPVKICRRLQFYQLRRQKIGAGSGFREDTCSPAGFSRVVWSALPGFPSELFSRRPPVLSREDDGVSRKFLSCSSVPRAARAGREDHLLPSRRRESFLASTRSAMVIKPGLQAPSSPTYVETLTWAIAIPPAARSSLKIVACCRPLSPTVSTAPMPDRPLSAWPTWRRAAAAATTTRRCSPRQAIRPIPWREHQFQRATKSQPGLRRG